jgi:hypothetical protein
MRFISKAVAIGRFSRRCSPASFAKILAAIAAPLLIAACGPPAKSVQPVQADATLTAAATLLQPPPADRARVIIVSGENIRYTGTGGSYVAPHYKAGDIYVNDTKIGTLNGLEAMVFDLAPGQYTFRWIEYKQGPDSLKRAQPSVRNLNGGGLLVLSTWYDSGLIVDQRYQLQVVNRNARTSKDGGNPQLRLASDIMVVRPSDCPPSLCL